MCARAARARRGAAPRARAHADRRRPRDRGGVGRRVGAREPGGAEARAVAEAAVVAVEGAGDDEVHARVERVLPTIVARRLGDAPVRAGKRVNVRHGEGLDHGHVPRLDVLDAGQEDALVGREGGLEDGRRVELAGHAAEGADLRGAFPIVPRKEALGDAGALAWI